MISITRINQIKSIIESDQRFQLRVNESLSFHGKEGGHSGASPMEDVISQILVEKCGGRFAEGDRELGDVYIGNDIFNIKFGYVKYTKKGNHRYGQPNMCAMNRILSRFVKKGEIDSYYIIKVKLNKYGYSVNIFDMFDIIDLITWNSGTGQIMLKESDFYKLESIDTTKDISVKRKLIADLYIKGINEHIDLRIKQRDAELEELKKLNIL
jgi:hypothetical protein